MKILILANHYNTLRIFRRELIKKLSEIGHDVVLSIPECDEENKAILESYGARVVFTNFERRGMNPISDFSLFRKYKKLIKSEAPDKVICYTIKCNIYGGLACRLLNVEHYANITGLGSTFQNQSLVRKIVSFLYKVSLKRTKRIFFENEGNRNTLVYDGLIASDKCVVLPGAGVNLDEFCATAYPEKQDVLYFLFIGRIMQEKGVDELFSVIKRLNSSNHKCHFDFIGWYEDNYKETVEAMERGGLLTFHGFQSDVKPYIERAHCIVHPSWHEGMSNTLLEASAMCRPIITSNIHGCKESVVDGKNGYLFEVKNAESLYNSIEKFISLTEQERINMGVFGRELMKDRFDKNNVVQMTLNEVFN